MRGRCLLLLAIVSALLLSGCTAAAWRAAAQGFAAAEWASGGSASSKLMIFGGAQHKTYLGCINCSEYSSDSVFNSYSSYGSSYSSTSIYNPYSQYGSPYAATSACNPYASSPPIVVDSAGSFYGYLTVNQYKSSAITSPKIVAWLHGVCGG